MSVCTVLPDEDPDWTETLQAMRSFVHAVRMSELSQLLLLLIVYISQSLLLGKRTNRISTVNTTFM